jgi:AcrR family transcriptional regulator
MEEPSGTKWRMPPEQDYSGGPLRFVKKKFAMSTTDPVQPVLHRPKRADARRNHEKVVAAAREAFTERGASTSLEEIARRAEVGIGTLYRNFPNRQALLEAVYVDEVDSLCRSAAEFEGMAPWEGFAAWVRRLVRYLATKQALVHELFEYLDREAPLFQSCRSSLFAAGEPLLARAQEAGVVRPDTNLSEVIQMVGGIAKIPSAAPEQIDHIVEIALDGLRRR